MSFMYQVARKWPSFFKFLLRAGVKKELGKDYDMTHFTPSYNPWDERLCLVPDADLFTAIKSGKAEMITDHIASFDKDGIILKSGRHLKADIIVSATGLRMKLLDGMPVYQDGQEVNFSETVTYKSMMFSGVPNLLLVFGYTNASWTLKCDLSNKYAARLLNYMKERSYRICVPELQEDDDVELVPFLDFTSGYIDRFREHLPKAGNKHPWRLKQNYIFDRYMINHSKLDDGVLQFL